ncbi:asparagine synthetase B [Jannaschia sp. W003]|uniref:asparagine synthetase B family protein n=1 Tax=Jannaschia sp. W003 TaxID=2867012 RepID=UPI0021A83652|nr:asparagine synthetase B [Jannaschia sp. W003]UWQ19982.1 asparagine synthetase B [Jannaschia sp. W003]
MSGLFATIGPDPLGHGDDDASAGARRHIRASLDAMRHRGADGVGVHIHDRTALGVVRLATIGTAPQPAVRDDLGAVAILDGTILNWRELRAELSAAGQTFRTDGDAEVAAVGYRVWGARALARKVRGGATFVIHDMTANRLVVVRDRFGERQLFMTRDSDGRVLVATEAKAILNWPGTRRDADMRNVHAFFTFRYAPNMQSCFAGVERLHPAVVTTFEADGSMHRDVYWTRAQPDPAAPQPTPEDACDAAIAGLDEALRYNSISDRPVGAFLSGGVDSTAIVARLAEVSGTPIRTFCAGFGIDRFDETEDARRHAELYGVRHSTHIMGEELIDTLDDLIWTYNEPFSDNSSLVTTALSRVAGTEVRSILGGDGAEQTFLGAARYLETHEMREALARGESVPVPVPLSSGALGSPLPRDFMLRRSAVFTESLKRQGYGMALSAYLPSPAIDRVGTAIEEAHIWDTAEVAAGIEMHGILSNNFLVKVDVAAALGGTEARSPFIDHVYSDAMTSLGVEARLRGSDGRRGLKAMLKHALEPYLPANTLYGENRGFGVPIGEWMRTSRTRQLFEDVLRSQAFRERGLFRQSFVNALLREHLDEERNHTSRLWMILNMELWFQKFIDGPTTRRNA